MALRRSTRVTPSKTPAESVTRPVSSNAKSTSTTKKAPAPTQNGIKKQAAPRRPTKSTTSAPSPKFVKPEKPSTPRRRRKNPNTADPAPPPPITPTPSAVGLMTVPYSTGDIDDTTPPPPPVSRPAEPHRTNAPLISPATSRLVAYSAAVQDASPSKTGLPRPTTSTATLLDEACAHLVTVDPKLQSLVDKFHCRIFSPDGLAEEIDPFRALVSGIMAQQVSGAAATSIKNKFVALFQTGAPQTTDRAPGTSEETLHHHAHNAQTFPTPVQVAATPLPTLRQAGLSQRKAEYIQGLAVKFRDGELSTDMLMRASDEEVLETLTAVRGLGRWSVEMFACFGLKRMDVFSTGDLGVQRGMAAYLGRNVAKLKAKGGNNKWKYLSETEMLEHSAKFAPYRSLFMWYMWRIENVDVEAMQGG